MKICSGCKISKELRDFHRNYLMKDGLQVWCKNCKQTHSKKYYRKNMKDIKVRVQKYKKENPEVGKRADVRRRKKDCKKIKARNIVNNTIRGSWLIPQPCEICGVTGRTEGHHEDYDKPLETTWLCKKCHLDVHRAN